MYEYACGYVCVGGSMWGASKNGLKGIERNLQDALHVGF